MKLKDILLNQDLEEKYPYIYLWYKGFIQYFGLLPVFIFLGLALIYFCDPFVPNRDTAQYFLSSMVQVQAAIVALVVTITLIVIQMMGSTYSSRVISVMKKNPDMWILLFIYLTSISIGFIVLRLELWNLVSLILILGIYTFVILFLYMKNTIELINPENIVEMLVVGINAGNIKQELPEIMQEPHDIMQSVFDVIIESINRSDLATTRHGLRKLYLRIFKFLPIEGDDDRIYIFESFLNKIKRASLIAIQKQDEGILYEIINVIDEIGIKICDGYSKTYFDQVINILSFIGIRSIEAELEGTTFWVFDSLGYIGRKAASNEMEEETEYVIHILGRLGIIAISNKSNSGFIKLIKILEGIGKIAVEKGLDDVCSKIANGFSILYEDVPALILKEETKRITITLGKIGVSAAKKGLDSTISIIHALEVFGDKATQNRQKHVVDLIIQYLESIRKNGMICGIYGVEGKANKIIDKLQNNFIWLL